MLAVVTDSTACLPSTLTESAAIRVVPLDVAIEGTGADTWVGPDDAEAVTRVRAALQDGRAVHTSQPPAQRFLDAYRELAARGAGGIISIQMSGALSGTCAAARRAAERSPVPVRVIDSATTAMPLGGAALRAVSVAGRSATTDSVGVAAELDRVESAVRGQLSASRVWFTVPDLAALRRSGRIGALEAVVGDGLHLRPVLTLADGQIRSMGVARGTARSASRVFDEAERWLTHIRPPALAVVHYLAEDHLEQWRDRARTLVGVAGAVQTSRLSAVIAAHTGPGILGLALLPDPVG